MEHVKDNVYAELISPGCNVGIIATRKGTILADTPLMAKQARAIQNRLTAGGHKPVRFIVMTHGHGDHILGTGLFGDEVLVVGSSKMRETMRSHKPEWVRQWVKTWGWEDPDEIEEMASARISVPEIVYQEELTLEIGGTEIRMIPLPGHLSELVGVFVPASGVLITGDALFCGHHPYMGEANLQIWLDSLDKMRKIGAERIVPGHGPVCGEEAIDRQQQYIEKMIEVRRGWTPGEGEAGIPKEAVDELLSFYPLHGRPESTMRERIMESIRVAGEPKF